MSLVRLHLRRFDARCSCLFGGEAVRRRFGLVGTSPHLFCYASMFSVLVVL